MIVPGLNLQCVLLPADTAEEAKARLKVAIKVRSGGGCGHDTFVVAKPSSHPVAVVDVGRPGFALAAIT